MAITPLNLALALPQQPGSPNRAAPTVPGLIPFEVVLAQLGASLVPATPTLTSERLPLLQPEDTSESEPTALVPPNVLLPLAPPPVPALAANVERTLTPLVVVPIGVNQLDQLRLQTALVPPTNTAPPTVQPREVATPSVVPPAVPLVPNPNLPIAGQSVIVPPLIPAPSNPPGAPLPQGLADPPLPVPVTDGASIRLDIGTPTAPRLPVVAREQPTRSGPTLSTGSPNSSAVPTFAASVANAGPVTIEALPSAPRPTIDTVPEAKPNPIPVTTTAPTLVATESKVVVSSSAPRAAEPIAQQLAEGFVTHTRTHATPERTEFQLQLEPQNLGRVRVHLIATGDEVRGQLFVADESVRRLIESQLPELRQRLESMGVAIQRFDVSTGSQSGHPWRGEQQTNPESPRTMAALPRPTAEPRDRSPHRIDVTA